MKVLEQIIVAKTSEIPVGEMKKFTLQGQEVLVANVAGNFYALGARCTHKNGDLSRGTLEGNVVTCPNHGAQFDVTTGKVVSPPKVGPFHPKIQDKQTYQVKVENQDILVQL